MVENERCKSIADCGEHLMQRNKPIADGTKKYWRCASIGCKGTAESAFGSTIDLVARVNHNSMTCVPSPTAVMIKTRIGIINQIDAANLEFSSHHILTSFKEGLNTEEIVALSQDSSIKKRVTNARRPMGAVKANLEPALMGLSDDLKATASAGIFFLGDSRNVEPEKPIILIYTSKYGLNLLRENRRWSGDGTFFSCPKHFKQLFTLKIFKEVCRPSSFCFQLENLFRAGADQVLKRRFLPMVVNFCLFHYSQSLYENFQKMGLVDMYHNSDVKGWLQSLNELALLPDYEMKNGFDC